MIEEASTVNGEQKPPTTDTDDEARAHARERIWNQSAEGLELVELPYAERAQE